MANVLNRNPIVLDTFNADITFQKPMTIRKIVLVSAADSDVFSLKHGQDDTAVEGIRVSQIANLQAEIDFGDLGHRFDEGLYFDASDINAGLGSGDKVFIYQR